MKSSFCIDLQRFMLIPTKFPLSLDNSDISIVAHTIIITNKNRAYIFLSYSTSSTPNLHQRIFLLTQHP